jgi:hypothetical protein
MTIQKQQAKFREQNLQAAVRIISDPTYAPGNLLKIWARNYLANHNSGGIRSELERRAGVEPKGAA